MTTLRKSRNNGSSTFIMGDVGLRGRDIQGAENRTGYIWGVMDVVEGAVGKRGLVIWEMLSWNWWEEAI